MKLIYCLNDKPLFETNGEVPLVGQKIVVNDFSTVPPIGKKRYKVTSIIRVIGINSTETSSLKTTSNIPEEIIEEKISFIEKSCGSHVYEINGSSLIHSSDTAEVYLEPWVAVIPVDPTSSG